MKVNSNNQQSPNTKKTATNYRQKQQLKFICRKNKTSTQFYKIHLKYAKSCKELWKCIQTSIENNHIVNYTLHALS